MVYPSLMYYAKPRKKPIDISVFEDLQLLNFIPKRVAKSALVPCEKENILPRQELFRRLRERDAREKYSELLDIANELYDLNRVFKEASTEGEKCFIFLFLCDALRAFTEKASGASLGDLLSERFASAFCAEKENKAYIELCLAVGGLISDAEAALTGSLQVSGTLVKASRSADPTYFDVICDCAATLGVDRPKVPKPERRTVSPDIINGILKLHPSLLKRMKEFYKRFSGYYQPSVTFYRKEIEFYLTLSAFLDRISDAGIPLTYPSVAEGRTVSVRDAYDVSLLAKNETNIVPNDISFTENEPFYFLTGANGGGKTTYLRTVGISVLMFLLGCPLPCVSAAISDISSVFTHFPRDERFDGSGRFVEENNRVKEILSSMDENSLVLLNETYSTTNEENAVLMTEKLANELYGKRIFGLYITHQHSLSESEIPYLNVLIDVDDENRRTFKIARQKSVGGSYAKDILIRCGLTYEALVERFGPIEEVEE